jgi:hypothetical protein
MPDRAAGYEDFGSQQRLLTSVWFDVVTRDHHFSAELVALAPDVILAHGAGTVECCKIIFAAQNNNIDSVMNAGTHRFTCRKQRECRFSHRLREGGRISEIAPPRRGDKYAATDQDPIDASSS